MSALGTQTKSNTYSYRHSSTNIFPPDLHGNLLHKKPVPGTKVRYGIHEWTIVSIAVEELDEKGLIDDHTFISQITLTR